MNANTALLLLGGLVAVSVLLGLILRRMQTRVVRTDALRTRGRGADAVGAADLAGPGAAPPVFGERLTALQFSSETCARCPATARVLAAEADARPGVAHLEVDITLRDDLIARFGLLRTPTVLLLDGSGVPLARVSGPVGRLQASELLDAHLSEPRAEPLAPAALQTSTERSRA